MRSVLITGASTGIGRASALQLDAAGWQVFAGVRSEEDAARLRRSASERLVPLTLDITEPEQIAAASGHVEQLAAGGTLEGLVNNAGAIVLGPAETLPLDRLRRQLEVNLVGHVAVTQAFLPSIRRGAGRLVFIGSIGGRMAYPLGAAYHVSKYGLEAFADCLRQELRAWRIPVALVEPGAVDTPIWERARAATTEAAALAPAAQDELYGGLVERFLRMGRLLEVQASPPSKVASAVTHALTARRPRRRYLIGFDARAQLALHRLLPESAFDWLIARALRM